ncbi:MAG: response regulator [Pseudanabaenaceae cyanobacterium]
MQSKQGTHPRGKIWWGSVLFFGFLAVGAIAFYHRLRELTLRHKVDDLAIRLDQNAHRFLVDFQAKTVEVQTLARSERLRKATQAAQQGDWTPAVALLQRNHRLQQRTPEGKDSHILLALPDGSYATSLVGRTSQNIRDRAYFQTAMMGQTFLSPPYRSRTTQKVFINISTPIWAEDTVGSEEPAQVIGVLSLALPEEVLWQRLRADHGQRYSFVLDATGRPLFHEKGEPVHLPESPQPSLTQVQDRQLAAIAQAMIEQQSGVKRWSPPNQPTQYVVFQPLPGTDWSVALVIPAREAEAGLDGLNYLAGFLAMVWLLAVYLRWRQMLSLAKEQHSAQLLYEREQALQSIIDNVAGVVYRCRNDKHWSMEFLSDFVETLTGYPPADFLGNQKRTFASLIHPEDAERVSAQVAAAVQWRRPFDLEYRLISADGKVHWVNDRGRGQWDDQGNLVALFGVLMDITDRKAAAKSLQEAFQEALALNAILENLAEGLLVLSPEGYILQTNQALRTMYNLPDAPMLSGIPLERSPLVSLASIFDWEPVRQGQTVAVEVPLPGQRVGQATASRVTKPQATNGGSCLGIAVLVRDITIEREVDKMKTDFIATVSHELRTPLTSVLGFASIVQEKLSEEIAPALATLQDKKVDRAFKRVRTNLDIITTEAERLTTLINDVLDIAKMEAGKIEWRMEPLDLREVIERALNATASLFERSGLACHRHLPATMPLLVGDRDRLIQVMVNLISNAVKFTVEGSVTCEIQVQGDRAIVSVTDTGMGIAPEDCPKVFEKFKQVGDTLTDKPKGTGLGLSICKQIIEHHGGNIWVESVLGQGSTFSFDLPLAKTGSAPNLQPLLESLKQQIERHTPALPSNTKRILVVDDEAAIRELLRQELEGAGYEVIEAWDGMEALSQVKECRPDLVVMDVMMPQMNGFDTAAVLRNDPNTATVPIVMLSIVQDRERGYRLGIDRYLSKPIDKPQLLGEIENLLQQGTSTKKVLIIDRNASTIKTLSEVLQAKGYTVVEAQSGPEGIEKALSVKPDAIVVDALVSRETDMVQTLRFERDMENVVFLLLGEDSDRDRPDSGTPPTASECLE